MITAFMVVERLVVSEVELSRNDHQLFGEAEMSWRSFRLRSMNAVFISAFKVK